MTSEAAADDNARRDTTKPRRDAGPPVTSATTSQNTTPFDACSALTPAATGARPDSCGGATDGV